MHELGHALGLQHGGGDGTNYKPNFLSAMNYLWQAPGLTLLTSPAPPAPPLLPDDALLANGIYDFSQEALATLWETPGPGHSTVFSSPTSILQAVGTQGGLAWTALSCPNRVIQAARGDAPIDFTCGGQPNAEQDINNDRFCVVPPTLGALSTTTASGDDRFQGGFIIPAVGGTAVSTTMAAGDVLQALPDGITRHFGITAGTMAIAANPNDGYLYSVGSLAGSDRVIRSAIVDGPDRTCNTAATGSDTQSRAVGNVQSSAALTGFKEWTTLQYGLSNCHDTGGGVAGAGGDTQELEALRRLLGTQQMYGVADLGVATTVTSVTTATATTAMLDVTVSNHGPASAVMPTLNLRLPNGLTPLTCDGQPCTTTLGNTVVVLGPLASGATRTMHFELSVGCNVPTGTVLTIPTTINDVTVDARPSDNTALTSFTVGPRLQDYTLFGSNLIDVDNGIVVQSTSGPPALLGNGGGSGITVGNKAQLGEIRSIGPVFLKNNVSVVGSIASGGSVTLGNKDLIGGTVTSHTSVLAPSLNIPVTFPSPSRDVVAQAGSPVVLAPGSYGTTTVRTHGELDLSAGLYFFTALDIDASSRVVLDKSQGPVTINVATEMTMKSSFVDPVNPGTRFLLQYLGTAPVNLAPFGGTFVAPNASVDLASPSSGVFLAKDLHAKSQVVITRRAFDPACQ